ncbi:MAG: C4-dicarboxylate ABC transporter, partial [Burkholderiaceae bacterium]|nr:C4-dicarboxylate ABC transporter [Burkholderiaceae bacterium]
PFGFALFYLRSVAPKKDYTDRVTGQTIPAVTTGQIYKGSIAFIIMQLIMVGMIMAFPGLVTGNIDKVQNLTDSEVMQQLDIRPSDAGEDGAEADKPDAEDGELRPEEEEDSGRADEDPMKALQESMRKDRK